MENHSQTALQEVISFLTIVALLVGLGCYVAALNNVPVLAQCLFWLAVQVYHFFPILTKLPGQQVPMLVSAATVGVIFFICSIPFASWLARALNRAGIQNLERQTTTLKTQREKIKSRNRNRTDFTAS